MEQDATTPLYLDALAAFANAFPDALGRLRRENQAAFESALRGERPAAAKKTSPRRPSMSILDFKRDIDGRNVLILDRWGERGSIVMVISSSGTGKSVVQSQMALSVGGMVEASRHKQVGNAAALREALYDIVMLTMKVGLSIHGDVACGIIASKAKHALSEPPRNCDVGTADEQAERFHNFCVSNSSSIAGMCDPKCSFIENTDKCHCLCGWAQMPYEADAAFTKTGENVNSGSAIDMEVNKPRKGAGK